MITNLAYWCCDEKAGGCGERWDERRGKGSIRKVDLGCRRLEIIELGG